MSPKAAAFKPLKTIGQTILAYREARPDSSCEEILAYVKKHFPGCKTTLSSISSTFSHAGIAPGRIGKKDDIILKPADINRVEANHDEETEDQARERIFVRYKAMERMAPRVIHGKIPSLIISGPPGVSKSWTVTESLEASGRMRHDGQMNVGGGGPMRVRKIGDVLKYPGPNGYDEDDGDDFETVAHPGYYDQIQGTCSAPALYTALWNMRNGGVLFLDDCDAVFRDEDALNILKVATDSTRERLVSWRKNSSWLDDAGIDKTFDFRGQIIFLTNIDFEQVIERGHSSSEHFRALIDRAAYLCLTLRTARDFMIVLDWKAGGRDGFLRKAPYNFNDVEIKTLLDFVRENQRRFYNLSLRLVGQIALMMRADPESWRVDVEATKMRTI